MKKKDKGDSKDDTEIDDLINEAIAAIIGASLEPGTLIGHVKEECVCLFIRYEGDDAICMSKRGLIRLPRKEIFDAERVKMMVITKKIFGSFMPEGLEMVIVDIPKGKHLPRTEGEDDDNARTHGLN